MIFILPIIILSLDQLTKFIVSKNLTPYESIPVIKGIFHLTLVHNRGAAFGILKGQVILFVFTSIAAIILLSRNLQKARCNLYSICLGLILAGAAGNLIDRLFFGYVIDFLDFRIWPVFNIADSAISIGAILLGYSVLKKRQRQNPKFEARNSKQIRNPKFKILN